MIALLCVCLSVASLYPAMAEEYFESQRLSKDNQPQYSQRDPTTDLDRSESLYDSVNDNLYQKNNQYDSNNQDATYDRASSEDKYQTSYNQIGYGPATSYNQQGYDNGYSQGYSQDNGYNQGTQNGYNQGAQVNSYSQTGYAPTSTYSQGGVADPVQVANYAPSQASVNTYTQPQTQVNNNYAQTPATNYAPTQTSGLSYGQTASNNYAPAQVTYASVQSPSNYAQAPVNNYAPVQAPSNYAQTPVNSYAPVQAPSNYAQAPVNSYATVQAPSNYAQAPVNSYAPVQAPSNYAQAPVNNYGQAPVNSYAQAPVNTYAPAQTPVNYAPVQNPIVAAPTANKVEDKAPATQAQVQRRINGGIGCGGVHIEDNKLNTGFGLGSGLLGLGPKPVILQDPQPLGILSQAIHQSVSSTRSGLANGLKGISDLAAAGINLQTGIVGALKAIPVRALNAVAVATNNLATIGRAAGDALIKGQKTTSLAGSILHG